MLDLYEPELLLAILLALGSLLRPRSRRARLYGLSPAASEREAAHSSAEAADAHPVLDVPGTHAGLVSQAARRLALAHEHRTRVTRRVGEHWLHLLARLERWRQRR